MAGTVTITERAHTSVKLVKFEWESDADSPSGEDAEGTTTKYYDGKIIGFAAVPDGGDVSPTDYPTDNYDIVITDDQNMDVLAGAGMNRDEATTEYVTDPASLGCVAGSKLTFSVAAAGVAKSGTAYLWIR